MSGQRQGKQRATASGGRVLDWYGRILGIEKRLHGKAGTRKRARTLRRMVSGRESVSAPNRDGLRNQIAQEMGKRVRDARPNALYMPTWEEVRRAIDLDQLGWNEMRARTRSIGLTQSSAAEPGPGARGRPDDMWGTFAIRFAAWRVLTCNDEPLPASLPLSRGDRAKPFCEAVDEAVHRTGKTFDALWTFKTPNKRTVQEWMSGRSVPHATKLEAFIDALDGVDDTRAADRARRLRSHAFWCDVSDALRGAFPKSGAAERVGSFALGILDRMHRVLSNAERTPPRRIQEFIDTVVSAAREAGTTPDPRTVHAIVMLELWHLAMFGTAQRLVPDVFVLAAGLPPVDEQARWLDEFGRLRARARTLSPDKPSRFTTEESLVQGATAHVQRYLVRAMLSQMLDQVNRPQDQWLAIAALVAGSRVATAEGLRCALALVEAATKETGATPHSSLLKGALLLRLQQTADAERMLHGALHDPDWTAEAHRLLGLHYAQVGRHSDAIVKLERVDDEAAPDPEVLRALVSSHHAMGNFQTAATVARRARSLGFVGFDYDRRRKLKEHQ